MPSIVQIYPSRLTITPRRAKMEFHDVQFNAQCSSFIKSKIESYTRNFEAVKNPFIISKQSKKKIMDSINSMYVLSKPRTIHMATGKKIFNYRLSFITLTLPSKQVHADIVIKKNALNQFLVELRKHYNVKNYLWKAELQKNENIHFHLILDQYVDFQALRRRWNRIINKMGYVDAYREKMSAMSLTQYHKNRNKNFKCSFEKSSIAYAIGKKNSWNNPNSVDVRSVYSKKELAIYLSKYIAKKSNNIQSDDAAYVRELQFGRSWFRSYSLSSLKYQNKYDLEQLKVLIQYLSSQKDTVLKVVGDYFEVYYFTIETLRKDIAKFFTNFIIANAKMYNYPFP